MERYAKLTSGVAVINVGAATEIALKETKDRVDDAIHATRAAAKEGYVPGGGVAYLRAIDAVTKARAKAEGDEKFGFDIVISAMRMPCWQIAQNSGVDGDVTVENILEGKGGYAYNAGIGEYQDLVKAGIIDPVLVTRTALQNAASIAGLMLTTDVLVTDLKDDADPVEDSIH
jgi:chaperonin GroEL